MAKWFNIPTYSICNPSYVCWCPSCFHSYKTLTTRSLQFGFCSYAQRMRSCYNLPIGFLEKVDDLQMYFYTIPRNMSISFDTSVEHLPFKGLVFK